MDLWSFPIAYRSTRLGDLYDTDEECAKMMRTIIRGLAQIAFASRFDISNALVWTHLFNPLTLIVRVEGRSPVPVFQNPLAASGELGKAFIAYNPEGATVLREIAEWVLKIIASRTSPVRSLNKTTIWRPDGWLIAQVWE